MSASMHAKLVPYSSIVGSSIMLDCAGHEFAQLAILTPKGPPPGESHRAFSERIAKMVADAINDAAVLK